MNEDVPVLLSDEATVRFPLVSTASGWRILFGRHDNSYNESLSKVSLSVPHGKIIGVIGRNGAGKSTLLRALAGVYPLYSGRVVRLGPVSGLFELGGMGGLLITGKQYIKRWLRLNGIPRFDWERIIDDVREFSELGSRLEDRIYTYSAGMAARLYFSTATSVGHEIYLIDEVLSVGDEHFQAKCWKRIRERLASGVSGVLVTHDWSAILRLCDYTYELENGMIKAEGNSERIICDYLKLSNQLDRHRLARFSDEGPTKLHATSGENWVCNIPIEIIADGPVFFNYSVEKLDLGRDWQILFFGKEILIGSSTGNYFARIKVASLPLPRGEYRLNLFLTGARTGDGGMKPAYDIRSWTTGNSIELSVDGLQDTSLVKLPLVLECM